MFFPANRRGYYYRSRKLGLGSGIERRLELSIKFIRGLYAKKFRIPHYISAKLAIPDRETWKIRENSVKIENDLCSIAI